MVKKAIRPAIFKWRQTEPDIILCAVRWYLRYSLSFRDVEERHCQLVEGSALLPREIDALDRSQQAHITASHSTNARVRSRR